MNKRIGWIGLGRMGEAMAKRLVKAAPLAECGATIVSSKLLLETAKDAGLEFKPENVKMSDGRES